MNVLENVGSKNIKGLSEVITDVISGEWGDGEGRTSVLRTTNFQNDGTINYSNVVKRAIDPRKIEKKALKVGDTIIEKSGGSPTQPVGRVVYFDNAEQIFLCNNFTSVLRPSGNINGKYLFWFLFNNHLIGKTLSFQNKTTGIINLKLDRYIKESKIPVPPLSTQKRIAEILDKADALRKKDQQLLKHYDDLAQSLFIDMFGDPLGNEKGWDKENLGNLIIDGPQNGLYKSATNYGAGVPILRIDSFYDGVVSNIDKLKRVNASEKEVKLFQIYEGDIVINRVNSRSHLGKCALVPKLQEPTLFESNMMRLEIDKSRVNPLFLTRMLIQPFMKAQILGRAKDSINQSSINQQDVKSFWVPLPPIEYQNDFALLLQNIEQQKEKLKAQIEQSENLFQALLQQAFKGGLD